MKKPTLMIIVISVLLVFTFFVRFSIRQNSSNKIETVDISAGIESGQPSDNIKTKGYKVSQSHDGEKEIYCTEDGKLVLVSDGSEKVIYENYREITANPYSIWSFDEYKIQWSKDDKYVYIIDSVYDLKNNKLIPIEDCVVFSWIDNTGIYLADGTYYEISYDGGLQNEMAIGKRIKVIENGEIKVIGEKADDRYFVLDNSIQVNGVFETIGDYLIVNTASLKYDEDELQEKIREDFKSNRFREFLKQRYKESLEKKYIELIQAIKESKEFQELQQQITDLESNYPIEFEGNIKELIEKVNDSAYVHYNVSGRYYLLDIREEEVEYR